MATHADNLADPDSVKESLECSICTEVFLDPLSCPCGHSFCARCLEQWLQLRPRCPLCRSEVQKSSLKVCSALRAECDAVQVDCPWRCGWRGRRDGLAGHAIECRVGYHVDLTMPVDGPLGIYFEILDGVIFVCSVQEGGAAQKHNEAHEEDRDRQIRMNDQVVCIDGIVGDASLLAHLMRRPSLRSITVRHPQELAVNLQRRGRQTFGIGITWSPTYGILTVMGMRSDATEESKRSTHAPSEQLLRHDRIVEVNGVWCVGKPDTVVALLRQADECTFKLHRPRQESRCSL